jgi:hypothetical protein
MICRRVKQTAAETVNIMKNSLKSYKKRQARLLRLLFFNYGEMCGRAECGAGQNCWKSLPTEPPSPNARKQRDKKKDSGH